MVLVKLESAGKDTDEQNKVDKGASICKVAVTTAHDQDVELRTTADRQWFAPACSWPPWRACGDGVAPVQA